MKKYPKILFSLLAVFALAACGKSNNNDNNNSNVNYNDGPLTFDNIEKAYVETLKQDNLTLTMNMKAEAKGVQRFLGNEKITADEAQIATATLERDNGKSKVSLLYTGQMSLSVPNVQKELNCSKIEAVTMVKEYVYGLLERGDYSFSYDEGKELFTIKYNLIDTTIYQITDPTTKQIIQIDEDGEGEYTTSSTVDFVEEMDEALAEFKKGKIEDGKVKYQNDSGSSYTYEFTFDGNKLSKISYTFVEKSASGNDYAGSGEYTFSKINSTSVSAPTNYTMRTCSYDHGEYACVDYLSTEAGHIPTCTQCEKFLGTNQPHNYVSNELPICKDCGYVKGSDSASDKPVEGFTVNGTTLLSGILSSGIYSSISRNYNYYDYLYMDSNTYAYYYDNVKAFMVLGQSEQSQVPNTCLVTADAYAKLYKNIPADLITQLNEASSDSDRIVIVNAYFAAHQPDASMTGKISRIAHTSDPFLSAQTRQIDQCHTASYRKCEVCNKVTYYNVDTNHVGDVTTNETKIDKCHTKVTETCPTCGEVESYIDEEHDSAHAKKTKEVKLDACHSLDIYSCPDCNEELYREVSEKHNEQSLKTSNKTIDSCTTATEVTCDACGMLVSHKEVSDHKHESQVVCSYEQLSDYGVDNISYYDKENLIYVFDYCSDCHKVSGNLVGYSKYTSINHPYSEESYYTFDLSTGYYDWSYDKFDHVIGDDGLCIFCHAKIIDINDQYQFVITCQSYDYGTIYYDWDYDLINKETGESLRYDYDYDEETGAYIWDAVPGMSLLAHYEEGTYTLDKYVLTYLVNDQPTTVEFKASDFVK
ncbi:MAG: hypothetical protein J5617_00520 [Bacilli bacterium]|nr:hypothetical protein [Bacilli bacterium]